MAETFTPAVCGGRIRRMIAVALFAIGAIAAAATLGTALGAAGAWLPVRWAFVAAAVVAAVAALREAGVLRLGVPALRRQVPERWRRERPLAVWSIGYGVILGAGFGTFLPTATFWAACAGAVAMGHAGAGAVCLAAFGVGRALMVVGAGRDPVERLGRTHRLVRPANVAALTLCAGLLAPTAAFGVAALPPLPSGQSDPSVSDGVIAYTDQANGVANVVILVKNAAPVVFPAGHSPSINGRRIAYVDATGIRVVDWRSGHEVFRQTGPVDNPSLSGTRLAYVRHLGSRTLLVVRHLGTGRRQVISSVGAGVDLGRPSLVGRRIAWHEAAGQRNQVLLRDLTTGVTRIIASSRPSLTNTNPVMTTRHIAWTHSVGETSFVFLRRVTGGRIRTVARVVGPRLLPGTMAITPGRLWVTRWATRKNRAAIPSFTWTP